MLAVAQLAPRVGLRSACQAFALNRGFVYRDRARRGVTVSRRAPQVRPRPPLALSSAEQDLLLGLLDSERFHGGTRFARRYASQARSRQRRWPERPGFTGVTLSETPTNEMQPKNFNQTRLLANLMTKGVSKSLTRSGDAYFG